MIKNMNIPDILKRKIKFITLIFVMINLLFLAGCSNSQKEGKKGFAYISSQKGNVLVMSLENFEIVSEIEVGLGNRGIGITDDGSKLVVAVKSSNDLAVVDLKTNKVTKRIFIGENPEMVRVRDGKAFVTFEPAAIGGPPPKPGSDEAKALDKKRAEEDEEEAKIAIVDILTGKKVGEIDGGMETEGIEFSYDGTKIIVTNEADENLSVHDILTGTLVKKIDTKELGNRPRGIKRSESGKFYLATLEYGDKLLKLDENFDIIEASDTGRVPYGISFSQDKNLAYIALSRGQAIEIFDTNSMKSTGKIPAGNRCWHFSFTPDNKKLIVACGRSNDVLIIDVASRSIEKRFESLKMPWGVVTYPKSYGTLDTPD
ncbi:hypothetical protein N9V13_02125 [Betaproteobacteria bacterium]|nr:hypothetical protein [Betaproteobacteria bacterium]